MRNTLPNRYSLVNNKYTILDVAQYCHFGNDGLMSNSKRRNNLERVRISKGMTRPELANKLNVTDTTIYRKERAIRGLSDKEAPRYAAALGVSVPELFIDSSEKNSKEEELRESEIALADIFKDFILLLTEKKIFSKEELNFLFNHRQKIYDERGLTQAHAVVGLLQEFVNDKPRASEFQTMLRLLVHAQSGSHDAPN